MAQYRISRPFWDGAKSYAAGELVEFPEGTPAPKGSALVEPEVVEPEVVEIDLSDEKPKKK